MTEWVRIAMADWPSNPIRHFRGRSLPEPAILAGYSALIERFDLAIPLPSRLAAVSERHRADGIMLWLVALNPDVLAVVQRSRLGEQLGRERMFFSLEQAVENYLKQSGDPK